MNDEHNAEPAWREHPTALYVLTWDALAKAGRVDSLPFRVPGTMRSEKVECVILTRADVARLEATTQAQPELATVLEHGLRELLAACDRANDRAIAKLGGIVIDLSDIVRAESALAGERVVAFCGGHRNVLSDAVYVEPKLDQDWTEPNS